MSTDTQMSAAAKPQFPKAAPNDNVVGELAAKGMASRHMKPVEYSGSSALYLPSAILLGLTIASAAALAVFGQADLSQSDLFRLIVIGGGGAAVLSALWAALRRRTLGLWAGGDVLRIAPGFPNLRLAEIDPADVVTVDSRRGFVGRLSKSGTLSFLLQSGRRITLRGIENSDGAHALVNLQVAAAKAAREAEALRKAETRRWAAATTPMVVNRPDRAAS